MRDLAGGAAIALLVMSPQFWLWHRNSDGWLALPADRFTMNWLSPDIESVLFSPLHGLTTWSPLLALSLVGLPLLVWRRPRLGLMLALALALQVWINGAPEVWWAGSAFGARRFAACGFIFAAGLAALLDAGRRRPLTAAAIVCAPFVLVNVLLVGQVKRGAMTLSRGATAPDLLRPVYDLMGNPFSFPANARLALEHGVPWSRYDQLGRQIFQRLRIDVGTPDDALFLTYGWSTPEHADDVTYRWATGAAAGVIAPLSRRAPYAVSFRAEPYLPPEAATPSVVTVVVNGARAGDVVLAAGMREYAVPVPQDLLRQNLNHVRFEFSRAVAPLADGTSQDGRALAVSFDWIEVSRQRN